jgi:hypothetical protein
VTLSEKKTIAPKAKKRRVNRTRLMKTLISDFHTRTVLKEEWRRLRDRFQTAWKDMVHTGNVTVQTWQTLYEHEPADKDNGWQKLHRHDSSAEIRAQMDSSYNAGYDSREFNEFNIPSMLPSEQKSSSSNHSNTQRSVRNKGRQYSGDSGESSSELSWNHDITQALLDRLLLLSLWFNERDIHKDLVSELLTAGADPNWVSPKSPHLRSFTSRSTLSDKDMHESIFYGRSALHLAACKGHLECLELLLNANANISALDAFESTPLHLACLSGQLASVRVLIDKGINIHAEDKNGKSCLHMAFEALDYNAENIRFNETADYDSKWEGANDIIHKKDAVLKHWNHIDLWHTKINRIIEKRRRGSFG